jgi:Secretion system C-terminal sorting domain/GEVED domain
MLRTKLKTARTCFSLLLLMVWSFATAQNEQFTLTNPDVGEVTLVKVTPPLSEMVPDPSMSLDVVKGLKLGYHPKNDWPLHTDTNPNALPADGLDPAAQKIYNSDKAATVNILHNYDGIGFSNVNPPDPSVAVGPNHVIQMINGQSGSLLQIYNKVGGTLVAQGYMDAISGIPGAGDPIVMYDQLADRWVLTEFSASGNKIVVMVSQTANPTGAYYVFSYTCPNFPDYPKFAIWGDAYYVTTNENSPAVYALNRTAMLAGIANTFQRFTIPSYPTIGFQAAAPVCLSGTTQAPAGTPGLIMRMADDAWTTGIVDRLEIFSFNVNWTTPTSSTLTGPVLLPTAAFSTELCGYTSFACIPQPGSGITLDPLREVLMNRVYYRNFGTHGSIVSSHVTDVDGADRAGVRWHELRNTGAGWSIYQEGTYSPDATRRWMSTIGINGNGDIAMVYNASSSTVFPSLRMTGRNASDPLGQMTLPETVLAAGTAANGSNRYGDYNDMGVDPTDGSFWSTGEYNPATNWSTRISHFSIGTDVSGISFDTPCQPGTAPIGVSTAYDNTGASAQVGEVSPGAGTTDLTNTCLSTDGWCSSEIAVQNSVWFSFVVPESGCYNIVVSGNDPQIAVWATNNCNSFLEFTEIAANDDTDGSNINSQLLNITGTPGDSLLLQIDGFDGAQGPGTILITPCECTIAADNSSFEWIKSVQFGNYFNESGNNGGYASFRPAGPTVNPGSIVGFNLVPGYSGIHYSEYWTAYVDWNMNANYTDAGEMVFTGQTADTLKGFFSVPAGATEGVAIPVRIVMSYYSPTSCGAYEYGETEDYTITVNNTGCVNVSTAATVIKLSPTSVQLIWQRQVEALSYNIRYRKVGTTTYMPTLTSASNAITITGLDANTAYEYVIRTKCVGNTFTPYSALFPFNTNAVATTCLKPSLVGSSPVSPYTQTFYWNYSVSAVKYQFQYRRVYGTIPVTYGSWINKYVTATTTGVAGLVPGTTYQYRVRTLCPPGAVANWTATYTLSSFTTLGNGQALVAAPTDGTTTISSYDLVSIAPNPTTDKITVTFDDITVNTIHVLDINGKILQSLVPTDLEQIIEVADYPAGVYFIKLLTADDQIITKRFIKM